MKMGFVYEVDAVEYYSEYITAHHGWTMCCTVAGDKLENVLY